MKKIILGIVIVFIVFFAFEYQKPFMTTGKAVTKAVSCVDNPPKRWHVKPYKYTLKDLQTVNIRIDKKNVFLNQLTNQRELRITLFFNKGIEGPTVKMNAYSGKCIGATGPLS